MANHSFVVSPHPQHFHHFLFLKHLIDESMLDVNPARVSTRKVTKKLLIARRTLKGILLKDSQKSESIVS